MAQMRRINTDLRDLRPGTVSMSRLVVTILLAVFLTACSDGTQLTEFPERKVNVNGVERGYRVYVPQHRDPNVKLPVLLYLHGSGARGSENREQAWAFAAATDPVRDKINFIVVLPQCQENSFWASRDMVEYSLAALDSAVAEFNGDPSRLYIAGFSLGGYGTWGIAAANPGKFAALMPVAGGIVGERPIEPRDREAIDPRVLPLLDSVDPYEAFAIAIGSTPVWTFHGAKDESVPVDFTRKMVKALEKNGNKNVKYTEYPEEGHMIFAKPFAESGFLEWLTEQHR